MSTAFPAQVHTYYVVAHNGDGKVKRHSQIMQELHMTRDEARLYRQNAVALTHPGHYLYTATVVRQRYAQALAEWDARQEVDEQGF